MNWRYLQFLDWSIKHRVALEQWLHIFGLLTMANPQHYSWASKHLPFSFELQMHYGQLGSEVPLQRPRFAMVRLVTSLGNKQRRLPLGNQCPVEGATYFFILKYYISLLSVGTSDSLAKSLAIRTGGRLGSQAARRLSCSLFFQWVLPGSPVCSTPSSCARGAGSGG